jgi:hypothetical protein
VVTRRHILQLLLLASTACQPDLGNPPSLVTQRRLLAVRGEPAEVRPGMSAAFTTLVVSSTGTEMAPPLAWALCMTPKPLDENNIVSGACLTDSGVMPVGSPGPSQMATVPLSACHSFGPDPPPQEPGKPPLRPRDPDSTGGYFQPIRAEDGTLVGFGLERITCNLASAGAAISAQFAMRYQQNTNPSLLPLQANEAGQPVAFDAIHAGHKITFTASWPADSVETYPVYDIVAQQLIDHREAMSVSWFATGGTFLHDRSGRDETETLTSTDNDWTAPKMTGLVHLWLVLRDSRGGVAFSPQVDLQVVP